MVNNITTGGSSRPTRIIEIEDLSKIDYYKKLGYKILSQSGWKNVTTLKDGKFQKVPKKTIQIKYME